MDANGGAMGVVDDLVRAREAYDRRDWVAAYDDLSHLAPNDLDPDGFATLATVAYLLGRQNDCVQALQRAYREHVARGERTAAARCGFWLARTLSSAGEMAVAGGWVARVERLLGEEPDEVVEHGYLRILQMYRHIHAGELGAALELAGEIEPFGRRYDDPDLVAMGLTSRGRLLLYTGQVAEGLALFDEAMTWLTTGEVTVVFAGDVYCTMVEGCQEVGDLGRAAEWTAALSAWCDGQTGLVAFTGQCAVHRAQIMRLHGAWDEAIAELERAVERYVAAGTEPAAGLSCAERATVLLARGDLDAAASALDEAVAYGHDPQPTLALLWLAQGRTDAALGAVRRLLAEPRDPVHRSQVLPAAVEVLLAGDAAEEARAASDELTELAEAFACSALRAMAGSAAGATALAHHDAGGALPALRDARRRWGELDAPYEVARCRALLGRALRALGDEQSARSELELAREAFVRLRARDAERAVAELLEPADDPLLSPREVEVLRLVAEGRTNQQVAEALVLSEKTIARHLSNIFTKLGVGTRTAAAAYAHEHGLV